MKNTNIVKLDRTTVQEFLPMLTHRGVFSNFDNLPKKDEILKEEMERLGIDKLAPEQERGILSKVGKYRSKAYVFRDYGDYVIAFSAKIYLDNLNNTEEELKDELLKERYGEELIQKALKKLNTYKLAHKIAILILGEVYNQRKYQNVRISKKDLITNLGYTTSEKSIYADSREAIHSLRWLSYKIFKYKTKLKIREDGEAVGIFIYNLIETSTDYIISVNPFFVGCAMHMAEDGSNLSKEERQQLFSRGYLEYPLDHLKDSRNLSDGAYYLGHYLLTQKGNAKLNTKDHKIIAVTYEKLLAESHIEHTRRNVRVNKLLNALEEIAHIQHIQPPISELRKKSSRRVEEMTLHIYIPRQKKVILKVQKEGKKLS